MNIYIYIYIYYIYIYIFFCWDLIDIEKKKFIYSFKYSPDGVEEKINYCLF